MAIALDALAGVLALLLFACSRLAARKPNSSYDEAELIDQHALDTAGHPAQVFLK